MGYELSGVVEASQQLKDEMWNNLPAGQAGAKAIEVYRKAKKKNRNTSEHYLYEDRPLAESKRQEEFSPPIR